LIPHQLDFLEFSGLCNETPFASKFVLVSGFLEFDDGFWIHVGQELFGSFGEVDQPIVKVSRSGAGHWAGAVPIKYPVDSFAIWLVVEPNFPTTQKSRLIGKHSDQVMD
jgi:hypothetical protein